MKHTSPENTLIFSLWDTVAKEDEHAIANVGRTQDQRHHGVTLVVPLQNELRREERPGTTGGGHSPRDTKETSISDISLHLMGGRGWWKLGSHRDRNHLCLQQPALCAACSLRHQETAKAKARPEPTHESRNAERNPSGDSGPRG